MQPHRMPACCSCLRFKPLLLVFPTSRSLCWRTEPSTLTCCQRGWRSSSSGSPLSRSWCSTRTSRRSVTPAHASSRAASAYPATRCVGAGRCAVAVPQPHSASCSALAAAHIIIRLACPLILHSTAPLCELQALVERYMSVEVQGLTPEGMPLKFQVCTSHLCVHLCG